MFYAHFRPNRGICASNPTINEAPGFKNDDRVRTRLHWAVDLDWRAIGRVDSLKPMGNPKISDVRLGPIRVSLRLRERMMPSYSPPCWDSLEGPTSIRGPQTLQGLDIKSSLEVLDPATLSKSL